MRSLANCVIVAMSIILAPPVVAAPFIGSAADFAVLGGSTVTNTGTTRIIGNLGVTPGTAITGLGAITLDGVIDQSNAPAQLAMTEAATAYAAIAALPFTTNLTGQDLGSVGVLTPGVYRFSSAAELTGNLVLDFAADPSGSFVFQIGSALTTASGSSISVLNAKAASSIWFDVGSSATLGTGTSFVGNILADQSITLNTAASICGRAIAQNGAVTMDTNLVSNNCGSADFGSYGFSGVAVPLTVAPLGAVPETTTWAMMLCGFGVIGFAMRARPQLSSILLHQQYAAI